MFTYIIFATAMNLFIQNMWFLPFAMFALFGIHMHVIDSREKITKLLCGNHYASMHDENGKPLGFVSGWTYIGYVRNTNSQNGKGNSQSLIILSTSKFYKTSMNTESDDDNSTITVLIRKGTFWDNKYISRKFKSSCKLPWPSQRKLIDQIMSCYANNEGHCVVFISGAPGCGKSSIAYFVANMFKSAHVCDSFEPTCPGDNLDLVYAEASPSMESPLIVILEEVDKTIRAIHANAIEYHKHLPITFRTKSDWSKFLDHIGMSYYPGLILIMTSNDAQESINALDTSYLRNKRVDICDELVTAYSV